MKDFDVHSVHGVNIVSHNVAMANDEVVYFSAGLFVTWHNPTLEITSMLISLYISDIEKYADDDMQNMGYVQILQADCDQLKSGFFGR